ncbi:MAG: TIGR03960 family B12-binding radical SAM protein [Candidatus Omnitrophica bacterium]|nr:TIGR03960 family B12-binding radical SAM protein [Candidatus Omnitrophota bacterium]
MIKKIKGQKKVSIEDFLLEVRKPARYIGKEFNSIAKDIDDSGIHFALCFPDSYEIGVSHLGIKILYNILNNQNDVCCERCFSPWPDMEDKLRERGIGLFSLESQRQISAFDIIGFSLQYELCYTNVLSMLNLSGIPLQSSLRDAHPLIIAGGPCTVNPEPMAEFIDVFFIGEAEESILEFINIYRDLKKRFPLDADDNKERVKENRRQMLREISKIPGIYVPRFYVLKEVTRAKPRLVPGGSEFPEKIQRRFVADLEQAAYFTKPPVPFIDVVHDRISLEIMRGCPHRCFFCQAGFTINPVRVRSVPKLLELARQTYINTGYDDISFCALSSASYPYLKELISKTHSFAKENGMGISLPSLRIDKDFIGILSMLGDLKKTGLTFAPEAGSRRLRKLINKDIDMERLKEAVVEAYRSGWRRLKLYFMIGLPTETQDDLMGIINLIEKFSALKKSVDNKRAKVSVGISNFIPKAHTPFQWHPMETIESLVEKQSFLRKRLKRRYLDVDFHGAGMSFIEASLTRGGRPVSAVIRKAYEKGARFDAWKNMFDFNKWKNAFDEAGIDPEEIACQRRGIDIPLDWSHIDCGYSNGALLKNLDKTLL